MSKYRYREVKNYIHNELKLTKEDIKEIMIPIVKEEVKRTNIKDAIGGVQQVNASFNPLQRIADKEVNHE